MEIVKKDIVSITADELMEKSAEFMNKLAEMYINDTGKKMPIEIVLQTGVMWVEVAKVMTLSDTPREVTDEDFCVATAQALHNIEEIIEHLMDKDVKEGLIKIASATIGYIFGKDVFNDIKIVAGIH